MCVSDNILNWKNSNMKGHNDTHEYIYPSELLYGNLYPGFAQSIENMNDEQIYPC